MIRNKEKKSLEKIFFNQITYFVIGFFVIILIAFPLTKKISRQYGLNKEISDLSAEARTLEGKNKELKQLIGYLGSDQFAEEEARVNLNLKKEGEEVVVINDGIDKKTTINPENNNTASPVSASSSSKTPYPVKWWFYFFN
jgi:cell division protein FtsB